MQFILDTYACVIYVASILYVLPDDISMINVLKSSASCIGCYTSLSLSTTCNSGFTKIAPAKCV